MNCRKAQQLLPLADGGDLGKKRVARLAKHLAVCSDCRKVHRKYVFSLEKARQIASREKVQGWEEKEWRSLLRDITTREPAKLFPWERLPVLRPVLASALLILLAGATVVLFFTSRIKETALEKGFILAEKAPSPVLVPERKEPEPADTKAQESPPVYGRAPASIPPSPAAPLPHQARETQPEKASKAEEAEAGPVAMTFISQQTGLKVYWYFDKNFDWKEKK